jgi:hypothetical protein
MFKFINVERENNIRKRKQNEMIGNGNGNWEKLHVRPFLSHEICVWSPGFDFIHPFLEFHGKGQYFSRKLNYQMLGHAYHW